MKCLILLNIKMNCISGLLTIAKILQIMKFLNVSNINIFTVPPTLLCLEEFQKKNQAFLTYDSARVATFLYFWFCFNLFQHITPLFH